MTTLRRPTSQSPHLIVLSLAVLLMMLLIVVPWVLFRGKALGLWWGILSATSGSIWLLVLWWSIHHLAFQIAALFTRKHAESSPGSATTTHFAILYPTCDDFQEDCCQSCRQQKYPSDRFRLIICDDSTTDFYRSTVDNFLQRHKEVAFVRRGSRKGFKAGNLNFAFNTAVKATEDWIVLVDADQFLPKDFLHRLSLAISQENENVAFVQTRHDARHLSGDQIGSPKTEATPFQEALGHEVRLFYERDLPIRQRCGFLPFLGHGAAIRASAWRALKGFPELVSEDYAFAMSVRMSGYHGVVAEDVCSWEAFPRDCGTFLVRIRKFAGGTAELIRKEVPRFFRSSASFSEKLDLTMMLSWYALMPLLVLNGFLTAFVCHVMWRERLSVLHPVLPYFFVLMFLLCLSITMSATNSVWAALRHWFWASAIYSALFPVAGWRFVRHLFCDPVFERTPKGADQGPSYAKPALGVFCLGIAAAAVAWYRWSPFSPVLMSQASAYILLPALTWLNEDGWRGRAMRGFVLIPGAFLIVGLVTMWRWTLH